MASKHSSGFLKQRHIAKPKYLTQFMQLIPDNFVAAQIMSYIWADKRVSFEDKLVIQEGLFTMQKIFPWGFEELCFNLEHSNDAYDIARPKSMYAVIRRSIEQECNYMVSAMKSGPEAQGRPKNTSPGEVAQCWRAVEALSNYQTLPSMPKHVHPSADQMKIATVREYIDNICNDLEQIYREQTNQTQNNDDLNIDYDVSELAHATLLITGEFFNEHEPQLQQSLCSALYDSSDSVTYGKLISFAHLCREYNAEWAVALFQW